MKKDGTTSQVSGNYVEFQAAILRALPRDIDANVAHGWTQNGESLSCILREALMPKEDKPSPKYREQDGIIYFSVTSDGTTGPQWIERLEKKGFRIGDYAKSILRSDDFKPTSGVTIEIAVLKGMLFADNERTTKKIRAEADERKFTKPNAEVACLIREMFTDEEIEAMGLWWIITMHEPVKDSDGGPDLLCACRGDCGRWLDACCDRPGAWWLRGRGFAFAVAQVGP